MRLYSEDFRELKCKEKKLKKVGLFKPGITEDFPVHTMFSLIAQLHSISLIESDRNFKGPCKWTCFLYTVQVL